MASEQSPSGSFSELNVSQAICDQLMMNTVTVPRIDQFKDIYLFIGEFELAVANLSDESVMKLAVKAFPSGRYSNWFKANKKKLTEAGRFNWPELKRELIARYAETESKDRHIKRLQTMKFQENGNMKLFDYVEDMIFSLTKGFPKMSDDESKISYVKANLPQGVQTVLTSSNDYNEPSNLESFMKAIRLYDKIRSTSSDSQELKPSLAVSLAQMMERVMKEIKDIRTEIKQDKSAKVAAIQHSKGPPFRAPRDDAALGRDRSPYRNFRRESGDRVARSPSPGHQKRYWDQQGSPRGPRGSHQPTAQEVATREDDKKSFVEPKVSAPSSQPTNSYNDPSRRQQSFPEAFDSQKYYQKFGYPDYPCRNCGAGHWMRHCVDHLN